MASGDPEFDKQVENAILARLDNGDVWAWASVTVTAYVDGLDITGNDHLGACSYANEEDFRKCGYFEDMCTEAKRRLLYSMKAIAVAYEAIEE